MKSLSLSTRLIAAALGWLALMLAVGGTILAMTFRDTVEQEFTRRLDAMLRAMIAATEISAGGRVSVVRPLGDPRFEQVFSGWYWQITEPGGRQVRSRSLWDSAIPPQAGGHDLHVRRLDGPRGEPLLVVERDLEFSGTDGMVHMLIAGDLREMGSDVNRFHMLLAGSLGLLGLGMALAVVIQVRFGLRPLRAIKADLEAVRHGRRPRLGLNYPREVAPLAQAMNAVLDHDAELIERARTHVGNLAHGLKTPLAVARAELEGGADKAVMTEQLAIMGRLIEHHLTRAAAGAGAGRVLGIRAPVLPVARDLVRALSRLYADRRLRLDLDVAEDAVFQGDGDDLAEILGNLMENACKWARSALRVSARHDAGWLVLVVEDDGQGLSPKEAAAAARRGIRLDQMAPGSGLGLSIVADLADIHGGGMEFGTSALGGLAVTLRFPFTPDWGTSP